ncbi:MAG: P1 family peptidase [Clostridia bacterium]|nr:P1 family peptidase [Clostridia bacterium]
MNEISINDIEGYRIGQAEDATAGTGVTVVIADEGVSAGIDIRGGGPASREVTLLDPLTHEKKIHAVVLAGGSAFGLDAAGGVMRYLEENGIGYDVGITKVPLVCQSDIFDLTVGDYRRRPDADMAYAACLNSEKKNYMDGNHGAGTGASVGKYLGMSHAMKSGIGSYAVQIGELKIGAVVVVNALGDIYDHKTGNKIAGIHDTDGDMTSEDLLLANLEPKENKFVENTTIGIIISNASFTKSELCKIAGMTHNGYARSIRPVHTSADGDTIYALANGKVRVDMDAFGELAGNIMSEAITRAVTSSTVAYGLPAV